MTERKNDFSKSINTNFQVFIEKLPNVQFFLTDTPIPDFDSPEAIVYTNVHDFALRGDKIEFGPITIGFIIDEYWFAFEEVYNWMWRVTSPENVSDARGDIVTDVHIKLLDNNKNPFATIKLIDAFPINLSGANYNVGGDATPQQGQITMRYSHFKFERLPHVNVKPPITVLPGLSSNFKLSSSP